MKIRFLLIATAALSLIASGVEAKGFHSSPPSSPSHSISTPSSGFGHTPAPAPAPAPHPNGTFGSNRPTNTGTFNSIPHAATLPASPTPHAVVMNTPPHAATPTPHAVVLARTPTPASPHAVNLPGRTTTTTGGGFHSQPQQVQQTVVIHHVYVAGHSYDGFNMPSNYYPSNRIYYYGGWGYEPIYTSGSALVWLMMMDTRGHEYRINCATPGSVFERDRCRAYGYAYYIWDAAFWL